MKKSLCFPTVSFYPWMLRGLTLTGPAMISLGIACMAGCAQDPPPFDPRAAAAWPRPYEDQLRAKPMYPLPTTGISPYIPGETPDVPNDHFQSMNVPEGPPVRMSLQDIIHRAMANNMEVRVASYDTAVDQTRVMEAMANFDPTLFADVNEQRIDKMTGGTESAVPTTNNPNTGNAAAAFTDIIVTFDKEQLFTSDVGIKENLPAGGKLQIEQDVANSWFDPARAILHSDYENDLVMTLTQPLLQNFGIAVNQARITVARNNQRVSLMDFRKTVEDTVLKIEQVYWQLVQTERDIKSVEELIKSSKHLREILYKRRNEDVTGDRLNQVDAEIGRDEVTLVQLQNQADTFSDQLKQLMNDPEFPVIGAATITPVDEGTELPIHFSLNDQFETALENRFELGQQQARIDSSEVSVDVARNNLLPSLTAQIQATVDGLGQQINQAFSKEGDFNHWGYQAGLQFSYPLGNRAAESIWQRSLLQRMQAIASYAGLVNQIQLDVKTAARQIDSTWVRLRFARDSRFNFQKVLERLGEQVDSGDQHLTFDFVFNLLQDQQELFQAEQTEHLAMNDYNFAIATLEKNKGTILRYNNVMMEQEELPFDMSVRGGAQAREMLLGIPHKGVEKQIMPVVPPPVLPKAVEPTTQPSM
jgi:outer membrane protein TolC